MTTTIAEKRKNNAIKATLFLTLIAVIFSLFVPVRASAAAERAREEQVKAEDKILDNYVSSPGGDAGSDSFVQRMEEKIFEDYISTPEGAKKFKEYVEQDNKFQAQHAFFNIAYGPGFLSRLSTVEGAAEYINTIRTNFMNMSNYEPWNTFHATRAAKLTGQYSKANAQELQNKLNDFISTILKISTPIAVLMFVSALIASMVSVDEKKIAQLRTAAKGVLITWVFLLLLYPIVRFITNIILK